MSLVPTRRGASPQKVFIYFQQLQSTIPHQRLLGMHTSGPLLGLPVSLKLFVPLLSYGDVGFPFSAFHYSLLIDLLRRVVEPGLSGDYQGSGSDPKSFCNTFIWIPSLLVTLYLSVHTHTQCYTQHYVLSMVPTRMTESNSYNRDFTAHKTPNIYYLTLYRKICPIPALGF